MDDPSAPPPFSAPPVLAERAALADPFRRAALQRSGLLDGVGNAVLDRVARVATQLVGTPVALVSLVDDRGQHFPGLAGLSGWAAEARGTPLSHSFCQHVVARRSPLLVEDAATHPLVRDNLARRDLGVVSYAGVPLTSSDGDTLGALCAIDAVPRSWSAEQVSALADLATLAVAEIELRATVRALQQSEAWHAASEARLMRVLDAAGMGSWEWDLAADRAEFSAHWGPIFGLARGEGVASLSAFLALVHPEDRLGVRAAIDDALTGRDVYDVRFRIVTPEGEVRLVHDIGTALRDDAGRVLRLAGVARAVPPEG